MKNLINVTCIAISAAIIILSCNKKSNSRTGDESPQPPTTTTTTGGTTTNGSTTGGTTGQATGTITGTPTCTLNPKEITSTNFISTSMSNTSGDFQNTSLYDIYNFNSSYKVHLYFNSTMKPASGGYSITPNNPNSNGVQIMFENNGGGLYSGYAQSGVVYVTNTGSLVSAVFCSVPVSFTSTASGASYNSIVSGNISH